MKLVVRFIVAFIVVYVFTSVIVEIKRPVIMGPDYPSLLEASDAGREKLTDLDALVVGDSTAKVDYVSTEISPGFRNLALGGATTIDQFLMLKKTLQSGNKPEVVFVSFALKHWGVIDHYWDRTVKFRVANPVEALEAYKVMHDNHESGRLAESLFADMPEAFGVLDVFLLESNFFPYYRSQFKYDLDKDAPAYADVSYDVLRSRRGYMLYAESPGTKNLAFETDMKDFVVSPTVLHYFRRIADDCLAQGIHLVWVPPPMNKTSYENLKPGFVQQYKNFVDTLSKDYPEFDFDRELTYYDNEMFFDPTHLDEGGARIFSAKIRDRLQELKVSRNLGSVSETN